MAQLVEAFDDALAAVVVLLCAFFVILVIVLGGLAIVLDYRSSVHRSRERQARLALKRDLYLARIAVSDKSREQRKRRRT